MTTQDELKQTFHDYQTGNFVLSNYITEIDIVNDP